MKYPECCYRIGNKFARNTEEGFETTTGYWIKNECELIGITTETLATLARENGERMTWSDVEKRKDIHINFFHEDPNECWENFSRNKDEPLGEFFLRVAKEREYL